MKAILQQIEIDWPLKALFHYVCDISNNSMWQRDVMFTEWESGSKKKGGARFISQRDNRHDITTYEITEWKPYQKRSVTIMDNRLNPTYSLEFEPLGLKTKLKLTVQFNAQGLFRFILPFMAHKYIHQHDLHKLKAVLEDEN